MNHTEEIKRLRNISNTVDTHLMDIVVKDTISALRNLTPSDTLNLQEYHGRNGICYPPMVNIEKDPEQDKNLQYADRINLINKGKTYLIQTKEGEISSDDMFQNELLDVYDELLEILEEKDNPNWEFTIRDGMITALSQS